MSESTARHVLLSGGRGVGKSAIIREVLRQTGLAADGYATFWQADADGPGLWLSSYGDPAVRHLVARRQADGRPRCDPHAFDAFGATILDGSGRLDVIVMDELGVLESSATAFQAAVLRRLAGTCPVLGVVKARPTPFLDAVRACPGVRVVEVTAGNRAGVVDRLVSSWPAT